MGRLLLLGAGRPAVPAWVLRSGGVGAKLDIDFVNDLAWNSPSLTTIASLLSVTGGVSTGSFYTKADGTLQSFANNVLRYGTNGLLVEGARINLLDRSQELAAAAWSAFSSAAIATNNYAAAPDGTTTASRLLWPGAGNDFRYNQYVAATTNPHVVSFYYKRADGSNHTFVVRSAASGDIATTPFTATSVWQRGTISFSPGAADTRDVGFDCRAAQGADASGDILIWGVQMEEGASASSYIPTTTAAVTRAAEIVTFSGLTWFDGAADSIYAEWIAKNVNNAKVWAFDATNDKLLDEQTGMSARIAGATVATTAAAGATVKAAARMALNDFAISMNGETVATDVSETAPGTLTASRLGCDLAGANHLNSYIKRVGAFKNVLQGNSALQTLTT